MIISRWLFGAAILGFGVFVGCRTSSSSDLDVVNGTETSRYDGSVVRILVDQARRRYCTGVAVDKGTLLMAAHCIKDASMEASVLAELRVGREGMGQIKATRYYSWSAVRNRELLTNAAAARDLAVVVFEGEPFKGPFMKLAPQAAQGSPVPVGTKVRIVGYGASSFDLDASVSQESGAQEGTNQIAAAEKGVYILTADLSPTAPKEGNAAAAAGDAGGPLLSDRGELLGIGAGVRLLKADKKTDTGVMEDKNRYAAPRVDGAAFAQNSFVDLGSESSRKLLAYAVSAEKKLGHVITIAFDNAGTGEVARVEAPQELTFSPDDTSWLEEAADDRGGQWVAATGRFREQDLAPSASLALLEAFSQSCVNGVCTEDRGPNSASTSMGGGSGPGGGWSAPQGGGGWSAPPANGGGSGAFSQSCVNGRCVQDRGPNSASTSMGPAMGRPAPQFSRPNFGMSPMPPFMPIGPGPMPRPMPPNFAPQAAGFPRPRTQVRAPGGMFINNNGGGQTIQAGGITIINGPAGQQIFGF